MKKTIYSLILFIFSFHIVAYGQDILDDKNIVGYKSIPQEKIYTHINTTFLLTGEYLYYKIYCHNAETNNLTEISKIAYIELIGSDKNLIFKHKIRLNSGLGQGDFFISSSIPSGNYKLLVYTQWMRNNGENFFFQNDISIINPFQENQKIILDFNQIENNLQPSITANKNVIDTSLKNEYVALTLKTKAYANREKVFLKINSLKNIESYGNYSISVRKIDDDIQIPIRSTTSDYVFGRKKNIKSTIQLDNENLYLPELRGELISGSVFFKDTKTPASNKKVALSIPGKNYLFKISTTNNSGVFYFNLEKEYKNTDMVIQVVDERSNELKITVNNQTSLNYNDLKFSNFKITSNAKNSILNHSINNQIENAYSSIKSNITKAPKLSTPFYTDEIDLEYFLNDYTRFSTIKETIIEVIDQVWISKKNNEYTFHVRGYTMESGLLPLVIIDGLLVQNHNELINFDARKIKKISVVRDTYIYGPKLFKGIISFETFDGNYKSDVSGNHIKNIKLFKPLPNKIYFNQIYNDTSSRIPDYRNQLLWKPNFYLNKKETIISFFTSDNKGVFEICLEGFTKNGKPVSLREIIAVK